MRTRTVPQIAIGPSGWLAGFLLALATACSGAPTRVEPRPLDAPVHSFARVYDRFLSPGAVARDLGDLQRRSTSLLEGETDAAKPVHRLAAIADREVDRIAPAADDVSRLLSNETERLGSLRHSRGFEVLSPEDDLGDLARATRSLPRTLHLSDRPMGESDDLQHRTDPDDDRPEGSFWARIRRRLFP